MSGLRNNFDGNSCNVDTTTQKILVQIKEHGIEASDGVIDMPEDEEDIICAHIKDLVFLQKPEKLSEATQILDKLQIITGGVYYQAALDQASILDKMDGFIDEVNDIAQKHDENNADIRYDIENIYDDTYEQ